MTRRQRIAWTHAGHIPVQRPDGSPNIRSFTQADFDVVFQPIVDTVRGRLFAHEALVRCKHPLYKSPLTLLDAAREQKTTGYLGHVIRQVALSRLDSGPVFVNIHPEELTSRWFVMPDDPIALHPHEVYLEITEAGAFSHFALCMEVLREVCDRTGAHLVVDDFGAGHSNMERVLSLRPSIVKLDATLIRGIDTDPRRHVFVRHLINMCADLGADVVAECVETVDELAAIRDAGARYVQGYLIARPAYPPPKLTWPLVASRPPPPSAKPRRSQPTRKANARASRPPRRSNDAR